MLAQLLSLAEQLAEAHNSLGELQAAEYTARVDAFNASTETSAAKLDILAQIAARNYGPEIRRTHARIQALSIRYDALKVAIQHGESTA
jgi:hypothetical protein